MSSFVYLAYDERMTLHAPLPSPSSDVSSVSDDMPEDSPFEKPNRIRAIYKRLLELETTDYHPRFLEIPCIPATRETIQLCHSPEHYEKMESTLTMSDDELRNMRVPGDLYFGRDTFYAARLACGGVIECVNAVTDMKSRSNRAMAIVRPPGHHATRDEAMGFCYFNNVAVAAKHACYTERAQKVFILDWDIHHGNGIQDLTYNDPQIFYLSIHRASFGRKKDHWFYPGTGRPTEIGDGDGAGTNLNIVWGEGGMGDVEYATAFSDVVLPILSHFKPDLIIIACGLDAAEGDLLGDCGLSPDMFYRMTRTLLEAAPTTPIVAALEGGYNVAKSAECMEKVALALLDEPLDMTQRTDFVSWSSASILPQRPHVVTHEVQKMNKQSKKIANATKTGRTAKKAVLKTARALERSGGTCLCGCHYMCHHSLSLPMKKRKVPVESGSETEALELPMEVLEA
eukprot:Nitzschia sp. Nitz4//scaffold21_size171442//93257//94718//NITZ4_002170-RA/size171442-processed-gene-0.54-mRNA-1//-1//CDS//3329542438//6789//frame0